MLRIEIVDDDCDDDEAHIFTVPLDVSKCDIMTAVETLFPTASSVCIFVETKE